MYGLRGLQQKELELVYSGQSDEGAWLRDAVEDKDWGSCYVNVR